MLAPSTDRLVGSRGQSEQWQPQAGKMGESHRFGPKTALNSEITNSISSACTALSEVALSR